MAKYFIFILLIYEVSIARGQQIHSTPLISSPVNINSSLAGLHQGVNLNLVNYQNWMSSPVQHSFSTFSLESALTSENQGFGTTGVGITVQNESFGGGNGKVFNWFSTGGVFAYHARILKSKPAFLNLGIGGKYVRYSIDWDNLIFSDHLNPIFGTNFPFTSSAIPPANLSFGSFAFDFGSSVSINNLLKWNGLLTSNYTELGLAISNSTSNGLSFYRYGDVVRDIGFSGHCRFDFTRDPKMTFYNRICILGKMDYTKSQGGYACLQMQCIKNAIMGGCGFEGTVIYGNSNKDIRRFNINFGLVLSNDRSDVPNNTCVLSYAYHTPLNLITDTQMGGGNHEITIIYRIGKVGVKGARLGKVREEVFF